MIAHSPRGGLVLGLSLVIVLFLTAAVARAQTNATPPQNQITTVQDAAEADGDVPRRSLMSFSEHETRRFSFRWGIGFLYDYSGYAQDDDSKTQMTLRPVNDVRDFLFLLKGRLPIPRTTYTLGYMYRAASSSSYSGGRVAGIFPADGTTASEIGSA